MELCSRGISSLTQTKGKILSSSFLLMVQQTECYEGAARVMSTLDCRICCWRKSQTLNKKSTSWLYHWKFLDDGRHNVQTSPNSVAPLLSVSPRMKEVKEERRNMEWAIFLTFFLACSWKMYFLEIHAIIIILWRHSLLLLLRVMWCNGMLEGFNVNTRMLSEKKFFCEGGKSILLVIPVDIFFDWNERRF